MDYADATELYARTTAGEEWDEVSEALANVRLAQALSAVAAGNTLTAREAQAMAIGDLLFAQMAFSFDCDRKKVLYQRLVEATTTLSHWSDGEIQRVEIPFESSKMIGWLVRPQAIPTRGTVLVFGGQSGWGIAYLSLARALARRGLATLLAEGPGQGETRLTQRVFLDVDVPSAYSRFVTFILSDSSLGEVGIWGNSMGGLWAASTAAVDDRIRACCINGAAAKATVMPFRTFIEQAAAMLGSSDDSAIAENFKRMSFDPALQKISCPLLVLHGGADPLVNLEDQRPFIEAGPACDSTLKVWPDGLHTIYNHSAERSAFVADWFVSRLAE
ncbi:alpha/beta hydrolase family protein [Paraburkholderia phenoliruptrix]|nr:alpha/beta hydrolase [Paraburkholderia phenoliruptrix]